MLLKTIVKTVGTDEDGVSGPLELAIKAPSAGQKNQANLYKLKAFNDALAYGVMSRVQLDKHLKKMDLWGDDQQAEYLRICKSLNDGELAIKRGGTRLKEARSLAIAMSKGRASLQALTSVKDGLDGKTAESLADQAYFNFLVAHCTVYNEGRFAGRPYFSPEAITPSVDLYIERSGEQVAYDVASRLSEVLYGKAADILAQMPENQFLKKYRFIDDDFNFIDQQGRKVDELGRRVDDEGYLVDEDGSRVDAEGNPLDLDGQYLVEFSPFLDDDGNPIDEEGPKTLPAPGPSAPEPAVEPAEAP